MAEHGPSEAEVRETICEFAGHEWVEAGGGLLICAECEAEKWAESSSPDREGAE